MLTAKTFSNMLSTALQNLLNRTAITNIAGDSRSRILLELPLSELGDLWSQLSLLEQNSFLSTATGIYLDALGDLLGVNRLPATAAFTTGPNFKFYLSSISGSPISIPAGTRVWPPDNPLLVFMTTIATTLAAGSLEVYVPVQAVDTGSYFSTGAYSLTENSTNNANLFCTNIYPISSGTNEEIDDNYRYRIATAYQTWATGNTTAIRSGLLKIPGVRDVLVKPFFRGTGSFDVLIYSYYPTVSDDLLALVQRELDNNLAAYGIRALAVAPETAEVGLVATISFKPTTTADQQGIIRQGVKNAVAFYLDNLLIGEGVIIDQIKKAALNVSSYINEFNVSLMKINDSIIPAQDISVDADQRVISSDILIS
jgi:uncharacterized phage protein gp47/JayE